MFYKQYSSKRWTGTYTGSWEGAVPNLERRYKDTESDYVRQEVERYMAAKMCKGCKGGRLKPQSLAVTVVDMNINEVTGMTVNQAIDWISSLANDSENMDSKPHMLTPREITIGGQILKEIGSRLRFLKDVGLDYLTIDRTASTLSGGESQRIRLATQIGSGLIGVLYVCDEPSVGLHPADDYRLIQTLLRLRDLGNTVLIVEHDEAIMRAADHIVDMGPGAGEFGGNVIATGPIQDIINCEESITGQYLQIFLT